MSDQPSEREASGERSPWSRASVLLSAAFLLLLVLAGVIVAVAGGGSRSHGTSAGPRPAATARAGADTTAQPAGACSLPAGDQSVPYSSPPGGVTWAQVGTIEVPQAPGTLGPQHTSDDRKLEHVLR